ncbi:endonuclease/exonuclease/phosphatase family protein [Streptomyces sp. NPDC088745]|uniref:endonuclease/exonuclease/phosphatase family protein n=1 Tax=Streptomyces sp. NPDC088745 TaxID=3365884 RepID=UPI003810D426
MSTAHPPTPGTDLVMFWNLHEAGIERLHGRDEQWLAQCALVEALRPRVLLTTEGWGWHRDGGARFEDAKAAFGMDGALFLAKTGCHQAVFWQRDIEPVDTEHPGHALTHWHGHGLATLRLPGWTTPLRFLVAHLDPFSPTGRRIEADHLRRYADPALPPLVMGMDANSLPPGDPEPDWGRVPKHRRADHLLDGPGGSDRAPVRLLLGDPSDPLLVDAGAHLGDRSPTFGTVPPTEAERRIDLFLISPSLAPGLVAYASADPHPEPRGDRPPASDHRPVTIRLRRR